MKYSKKLFYALSLTSAAVVSAQSFCNSAKHSGQSVTEYKNNAAGSIGEFSYDLWFDGGSNSATFYSDGSFSCSFRNTIDCKCQSGLSFTNTQTNDQIAHIYADFKFVKQNIQNVSYSFVGVYGYTRDPLVEFYIVDSWVSQYRPGDWIGNKKHGDFTIDGANYTVYENTRTGQTFDGDIIALKQFFSIRLEPRDCGRIDITAHLQQWEKLGMKRGKIHEAKILGEFGSGTDNSGTIDFPYAKVFIGDDNDNPIKNDPEPQPSGTCSTKILAQGYKCCSASCQVVYTDNDGTWGVENNEWCGCDDGSIPLNQCSSMITNQGYKCCSSNCEIVYTDADGTWGVENNEWCGCSI